MKYSTRSEGAYKNLNLYEGVRGTAIKLLNRIDRTDAYLDKLLDIEIKNSELSGIDKALLFEVVHGVIRWLKRIDWVLNGFYKGQFSKCIPNVKNAMRVALYQILFLDKIPDYAAVNEAVEFVKKIQGQKSADLTNAVLRNIIRNKENIRYPDPEEDLISYLSVYYSHPTWLVKRWLNRYGEKFTRELLIANNRKPSMTLRVNRLKTTTEEMGELLHNVELEYQVSEYLPNFFKLSKLTNIQDWEYFAKGYFTIQDESTAFACNILDIEPEMRVLDLCAAPGGKTAYLAELMNNTGELVALDKFESRLKILNKNLKRLGVENSKTIAVDALEYEDEHLFDRILVDAPCSGLGTLTKKPDIKWKKDLLDIRKLTDTQLALLEKGASLLKPGGYIVYSTCTLEPEENIEIVRAFLEKHDEFEMVSLKGTLPDDLVEDTGTLQTFPNVHQMDGAFAAKLIRKK